MKSKVRNGDASSSRHAGNERLMGPRNNNWRGGRSLASNGYVILRKPGHPMADVRGYVYEHRFVISEKIGRVLNPGEVVHHVNGNKSDNRPENLELKASHAHHYESHRRVGCDRRLAGEENVMLSCECGCGETFLKFDKWGRPRKFVSGHNIQPVVPA